MQVEEQRTAFERALNQHKGILVNVTRAYCKDGTDRQDLMQEILVHIWQSIPKYHEQFKMSTWLYRIAINVAISYFRKQSIRDKLFTPLPDESYQPVDLQNAQEQQLLLLERFISELNDLDKALMILYLEKKSHTEISQILGISTSNVGTKTARIKVKLKQRFSQFKTV